MRIGGDQKVFWHPLSLSHRQIYEPSRLKEAIENVKMSKFL